MNSEYDIIMVNLTPWDYPYGNNACNIAEELALHHRVLYVNPPLDRYSAWHKREEPAIQKRLRIIAGKQDGLEQINEKLWVLYPQNIIESINWIPSHCLFKTANKWNNRRLASNIRDAADRLGFKSYVIFNDNDIFRCFHLQGMLNPRAYFYYIRDQLVGVKYWRRHGLRIEPLHIAKADAIMANSTYLADYGRQFNSQSFYVGQGCDLSAWNPALIDEIPEDLRPIASPIVGYVGALDSNRLDIELIAKVAENRTDWNIVLVGPEDDNFLNSRLHKLSNVIFLGSKKPAQLPAYVQGFDVCINPQAINPITIGNYPRKIDEYLAMGKPTVATRTKGMKVFEEHTYLAQDFQGYIEVIQKALDEDSEELAVERREFASMHTWENNVVEIREVMARTLDNNFSQLSIPIG